MSYFFFQVGRSLIPEWWLKLIGALLLLNAGLFVLPMGLIAAIEAKWSWIEVLLGLYSIPVIPLMTVLLLLVIIGGIVVDVWRRGWESLRSRR